LARKKDRFSYNEIHTRFFFSRRWSIMKNTALLPIFMIIIGLAACAPAAANSPSPFPDTPMPAAPTIASTVAPSQTPDSGPWQVIRHLQYVQSIYQAGFLDDDFGIMVGYSGAVYYTTDGGKTWSHGNNTSWCRFGLDIVSKEIAWNCGNGGHVRLSTDGGKNWQAVADFGGSEPDHCRMLSFLDAQTGWAATPKLLGATTDGGTTWEAVALPEGIGEISAISLRTGAEGYLLDTAGTIYITVDGGRTWTTRSLGLSADEELSIAFAPTAAMRFTDSQVGMVVFAINDSVFSARTTDGGRTWKREPVGIHYKVPALHLSHDGITLTAIDGLSDLMVLRYRDI
jgi:photosystem II stability/assembly factor-like uncharacterized protein